MIELPRTVLDRYPVHVRPTSPTVALGNAGGLSGARLWRFDSARGPIVARLWPVDGPSPQALNVIHGWIKAASDLDFVASPLASMDGRTFVETDGRIWELAPWMPGQANLSRPPPIARVRAAFAGLAAFHARLATHQIRATSRGIQARFDEVRALIASEFTATHEAIERQAADPLAPIARRWLNLAREVAPRLVEPLRRASVLELPIQPCLRDARPDHFLFHDDRLTGLIDFGAMGRDSIAGDLARLIGESLGTDRDSRDSAMEAYQVVRPIAPDEWVSLEAFERANAVLGAGRWVRWHFVEGRIFDDEAAVRKGIEKGLDRLIEREINSVKLL